MKKTDYAEPYSCGGTGAERKAAAGSSAPCPKSAAPCPKSAASCPESAASCPKSAPRRVSCRPVRRAVLLTVLLAASLLLVTGCGGAFRLFQKKVMIPDPALKKAIQEELGIGDREITEAEAGKLTELHYDGNLHDAQIADLTGISSFPHLQVLDVHGNADLEDLGPLSGLTELRELDLHGNFLIRDLSPLAELESLERVDLERVYWIRDISPLEKLPNLTDLNLRKDYFIDDLSPLEAMHGLQKLNLAGIRLHDTGFLEKLPELQELRLQDNRIEDIRVLEKLRDLRLLNLHNNQITDTAPLRGLTKMENLDLGYNLLTDAEDLSELTQITDLCLSGNRITDLAPLSGMTGMRSLKLDGNSITDIGALEGMTQMENLSLCGAQVRDLTPLRQMKSMTSLELQENPVGEVSALSGMTELTYLSLSRTGITDLKPLAEMTELTRLELWGNRIEDISPLRKMTKLERLEINDNRIEDISALEKMTEMEYLEMDENRIEDISVLRNLTGIKLLQLARNRVSDVTPLAQLQEMFWLELSGNPVRDLSVLQGLENLEFLETETPFPRQKYSADRKKSGEETGEDTDRNPEQVPDRAVADGYTNFASSALTTPDGNPDLRITSIFTGMDNDGDAILLQSDGYNLLMDTGNTTTDHVIQTLKQMGVRDLDIYLSHWHDDHYGQILRILDDDDFSVGKLLLPESEVFSRLYDVEKYSSMPWWKDFQRHYSNYCKIMEEIEKRKIEVTWLKQGSTFGIGTASAEVLFRNEAPYLDNSLEDTITYVNNTSLVTMITTAGGVRYLTCGDIERETEEQILQAGIDIRCDIFKMNHHGCRTSNTEAFLEAASPSYAFYNIQEKKYNKKTYFLRDCVSRLMQRANVFSGAGNGDMTFTVRGTMIDADAQYRTRTETIRFRTADGREETRDILFNADAPSYLDACALPEGAGGISGGSSDLTIRIK